MNLPSLTLNRQFIADFSDAPAPCCALGLVKADGKTTGFFAVKPDEAVPPAILGKGIGFGHRMLTHYGDTPLCQFAFDFYGFAQYSVLVNPSNPLALRAMETMIEQQDYFFFILGADERVTAFRSELEAANLAGMRDSVPMMRSAQASPEMYELAVDAFRLSPTREGMRVLTWVCRDDPAYMDVEENTFELPPIG